MTNEGAAADASARTENVDAAVRETDDKPVSVKRNRGRYSGRDVPGTLNYRFGSLVVRRDGNATEQGTTSAPFSYWIVGINVGAM